jgi:hypothetical protein
MRHAFGRLGNGVSPHHLHQWWRLRDAFRAMEQYEQRSRGGQPYRTVMRVRSDLRLPSPLQLAPGFAKPLHGADASRGIVMRGDWIFWGSREAMRTALTYVDALPRYHQLGQRTYMPLPFRHMLYVGTSGLDAGLAGWMRYPKQERGDLYFGFPPNCPGNNECVIHHVRNHLSQLEAFHSSGADTRLRPEQSISNRDGWWRWDGIPDNEKYFLYHVLNSSLVPVPFLDLHNRYTRKEERVTLQAPGTGLLMPQRKHPNCSCICDV